MALLTVEQLGLEFGGLRAVHEVSLRLAAGEILSIIGPNGAGKTTLFNLISGVYRPQRGQVYLHGKNISGLPPHALARLGLARTFQNLQIFSQLSVLENVMAGLHIAENPSLLADLLALPATRRREKRSRAAAWTLLEKLGLAALAEQDAASLAYGQRKRLEIARALAAQPVLLLLDEPAAGCNTAETQELQTLICALAADGMAVLLVEHDMKMVMGLSQHIIVLDHGEKIAEGTPAEIQKHPKVLEAYLGSAGGGPND